jgi:hypothetical protein
MEPSLRSVSTLDNERRRRKRSDAITPPKPPLHGNGRDGEGTTRETIVIPA